MNADTKNDSPQAKPDPLPSGFLLNQRRAGPKAMQRSYSFGLSESVNANVEIVGPAEVEGLEALKDYVETLIKSWRRNSDKANARDHS